MPYSLENRRLAREFLRKVRSETVCLQCGRQPVDFHNEEHLTKGYRRVSRLAAVGFPVNEIQREIDRCEPLCRSCHMKDDGRLDALSSNKPRKKGTVLVEAKPCSNCGRPTKPTRRGKCRTCYDKDRRS